MNFGLLTADIRRLSRLGSVTARQSSSGRQPNFAALNRGRHLCSAGRPSRWASAHILFFSRLCSAAAKWMSTILPHDVALVRIQNAGLKYAAHGSPKMQDAKNRRKIAIYAPSHKFVGLYLLQLGHVSTIGKNLLNSNISSTCLTVW